MHLQNIKHYDTAFHEIVNIEEDYVVWIYTSAQVHGSFFFCQHIVDTAFVVKGHQALRGYSAET